MNQALRDVEGGIRIVLRLPVHLRILRRPPVFEYFLRQLYFTGVTAATGLVLRASLVGVVIIAYTIQVLDADAALAVKILLWVVMREIGPLAAALIVILRDASAMSAELAIMRISGQTDTLRHLRVNPYDYLIAPRMFGLMLATVVLTFYIQFLAVVGGMLLSPLVIDATFEELSQRFLELVTPIDLLYSVVKSMLFGLAIAAVCCHHGLNPPELTQNGVPKAVSRAVTQSAMVVLVINTVFAYLVFGILLFGLIKAEL
jgi:phospholipid/cholesterol/gamma-HCH transport system permease protein